MTLNAIELTIGKSGDWPCYVYRRPLTEGEDSGQDEKIWDSDGPGSVYRPPEDFSPERFLDIYETNDKGTRIYVFDLKAEGLDHKPLLFPRSGSRFIFFPMGGHRSDKFLKELPGYAAGNRNRAAFECDLDALRQSDLAKKVRKYGGIHNDALNIPFYFRFEDQVLGAAPWIIPDHTQPRPWHRGGNDHGHGHDHDHDRTGADQILDHDPDPYYRLRRKHDRGQPTHGGVHPKPLSVFSVPID